MLLFIVRRLGLLFLVLVGASALVFLILHSIPGDPATILAGPGATKAQVEAIRRELGFDRPLIAQYVLWLRNLMRGDLGKSYRTRTPVLEEIGARVPATAELGIVALLIATLAGIAAGILAATRPHSFLDYATMVLASLGVSTPVFLLGLLLIYMFGVYLPWLPIGGRLEPGTSISVVTGFHLIDSLLAGRWDLLRDSILHMILPAITLATVPLSIIARITRATVLEVMRQDYIRTARSKGLHPLRVLLRHALRNALIPITTVIGVSLGHLVAGAVLTETVFAWPGLGRYLVASIDTRDFSVIQGIVLFTAAVFGLTNLAVDVFYAYLDPRIGYG